MRLSKNGITLVELIIAISLLSIIILAATAFDQAIRRSFQHSDVQMQLLTQVSPAMQHMTKFIMQGIGSVNSPAIAIGGGNRRIKVRLDANNSPADCTNDRWIFYRLQGDEIRYCPNVNIIPPATACDIPNNWNCALQDEVIVRKISDVQFTSGANNSIVDISITACQDPDGAPIACGDARNPQVNLTTSISLREASAN